MVRGGSVHRGSTTAATPDDAGSAREKEEQAKAPKVVRLEGDRNIAVTCSPKSEAPENAIDVAPSVGRVRRSMGCPSDADRSGQIQLVGLPVVDAIEHLG